MYEYYKFLYDWKRQVLFIFHYAKIWRIYRVCQNTNMKMMKMLNYQFIIPLPKVFNYVVNLLKYPNLLNIDILR